MTTVVAEGTVHAASITGPEAGLPDSVAHFRLLADNLPGVLYLRRNDEHYSMLYLNEAVEDLTGYTRQAFLDQSVTFGELCHPEDRAMCDAEIDRAVARNRAFHLVYRLRHRFRGWRWVEEHGVGVHREGELKYVEGFICDITSRRRLERRSERRRGQLEFEATHDTLTGLINRAEFERRLERAVRSARKECTEHSLCYLDLDHFKQVNDQDGHLAGDEVLRQVSRQLAAAMRARDTLARLGGDEFGLLLEHCRPEQGREVAATVLQTVRGARLFWKERDVVIGISIGVVSISANSESPSAVLRDADAACYAAKARGGNCVHVSGDVRPPTGLREPHRRALSPGRPSEPGHPSAERAILLG